MLLIATIIMRSIWQKPVLDKTGTTGGYQGNRVSQVLSNSALARLGSFEAERSGFEPEKPVTRLTGFGIRR